VGVLEPISETRIVDTRTMPWETFPGLPNSVMKPLVIDSDGVARVMIRVIKPSKELATSLPTMPYRHYHSSVAEHTYYLAGDLPHWDYASPEDGVGALVDFKAGYFLDGNPGPGGLHGIEDGPRSKTGGIVLNWRNGVGNNSLEPNFHEESIQVDYPAGKSTVATVAAESATDGSGVVYQSEARTILDTRAMRWQQFPGTKGGYIKVLARDPDGVPKTLLGWLPRGNSEALRTRPDKAGQQFRENIYVLRGSLPHPDGNGGFIHLPEGTYIDRPVVPDSPWEEAATTPEMMVGATVLMWRAEDFA